MKGFYTTLEAAEKLGITRQAVIYYSHKYNIGEQVGRTWFYTAEDIEEIRNTDNRRKPK